MVVARGRILEPYPGSARSCATVQWRCLSLANIVWELRISELELGVFLLFLYDPELHMLSLFYPLHFEDSLHCDEGKLDMITSIGY